MEQIERDRQLLEEFANDLKLSRADVEEIENNEKVKEQLCALLKMFPVIVDNKLCVENKFVFWSNYTPDFIPVRRLFKLAHGFGCEGISDRLRQKILHHPGDLARWLAPVYWQDNLRSRDTYLQSYSWEELKKYEWANKKDYMRAKRESMKTAEPVFDAWSIILVSVLTSPLVFLLGLLTILVSEFVAIVAAENPYPMAETMLVSSGAWIIGLTLCAVGTFSLLYLGHLRDLWKYNQRRTE